MLWNAIGGLAFHVPRVAGGDTLALWHETGSRVFPRQDQKPGREMADVLEGPRVRVSASQLSQYIGKPVCFVGRLEKIHPSGKLFFLTDGEGKNAAIELNTPLEEEISGIIEVVGRVTNQLNIICSSYMQFKEDKSMFDLSMYNEAVKVIHEFPEYYPFSTDI